MTIRWRRLLPVLLPVSLTAIAFSAYSYSRPTIQCVIVNERLQTTSKASGKRCTALLPDEEAIVLTSDGVYGVSNN